MNFVNYYLLLNNLYFLAKQTLLTVYFCSKENMLEF